MPLPTYFISHGGGPWPWMEDRRTAYAGLARSLSEMPGEIGSTPAAVLMISAHWEESEFTLMGSARPPMLYDYSNFPPHTYEVSYPAPGSPVLAEQVRALIEAAGQSVRVDSERGFDHGAFVPLSLIYPQADVPVVQLSLKRGLDPAAHLALGRALAPLRDENVLIVGSGLSYHNLRAFGPAGREASIAFDGWLQQAVVGRLGAERAERLLNWVAAPAARAAHPREEHLIPLLVAAGAAEGEPGVACYHEDMSLGIVVSSFRFGVAASSCRVVPAAWPALLESGRARARAFRRAARPPPAGPTASGPGRH